MSGEPTPPWAIQLLAQAAEIYNDLADFNTRLGVLATRRNLRHRNGDRRVGHSEFQPPRHQELTKNDEHVLKTIHVKEPLEEVEPPRDEEYYEVSVSLTSQLAPSSAPHIHDSHTEINCQINISDEQYKFVADTHCRSKEFDVDYHVEDLTPCPDPTPSPLDPTPHQHDPDPNIDLPDPFHDPWVMDLSSPLHDPCYAPVQPTQHVPPLPSLSPKKEKIEFILVEEVVSTVARGHQQNPLTWKPRPMTDVTLVA